MAHPISRYKNFTFSGMYQKSVVGTIKKKCAMSQKLVHPIFWRKNSHILGTSHILAHFLISLGVHQEMIILTCRGLRGGWQQPTKKYLAQKVFDAKVRQILGCARFWDDFLYPNRKQTFLSFAIHSNIQANKCVLNLNQLQEWFLCRVLLQSRSCLNL